MCHTLTFLSCKWSHVMDDKVKIRSKLHTTVVSQKAPGHVLDVPVVPLGLQSPHILLRHLTVL